MFQTVAMKYDNHWKKKINQMKDEMVQDITNGIEEVKKKYKSQP